MDFLDVSFGSFLYVIEWLGFGAREHLPSSGCDTTTQRPIGG